MNYSKVNFKNSDGDQLSGYLDLPINREPHTFVLFAHCFTCNKNFFAVKNIARALSKNGYGVLRFDFTGLGESEGDFSETNFSGNVSDLIAAAEYLKKEHTSPSLLIGHSLGGAAVLYAAQQIPSVKAVATIGTPSTPLHVTNLLRSDLDEIQKKGLAKVNVGGRDFTIKEQFLQDLKTKELKDMIKTLKVSILVMHSPQDKIVGINNAEELYISARHPKSFVSLDGADHLLSNEKDSIYTGEVIASWAKRYLEVPDKDQIQTTHEVVANLGKEGFTTEIKSGKHYFTADEPEGIWGKGFWTFSV